jgi:hypothetical protein
MARADKATTKPETPDPDREQNRRRQPGAQGFGKDDKAVDSAGEIDKDKLKRNQEQLQVDEHHKTPDMQKQERGSFP